MVLYYNTYGSGLLINSFEFISQINFKYWLFYCLIDWSGNQKSLLEKVSSIQKTVFLILVLSHLKWVQLDQKVTVYRSKKWHKVYEYGFTCAKYNADSIL